MEYRQEKVDGIVQAFAKVLRESDLSRSEGLNAVIMFVYEVAKLDAAQADACPRCIAVAMVECLFAQPGLQHNKPGVHPDVEVEEVKEKKEGAN